jgi:hypothetical protein
VCSYDAVLGYVTVLENEGSSTELVFVGAVINGYGCALYQGTSDVFSIFRVVEVLDSQLVIFVNQVVE